MYLLETGFGLLDGVRLGEGPWVIRTGKIKRGGITLLFCRLRPWEASNNCFPI